MICCPDLLLIVVVLDDESRFCYNSNETVDSLGLFTFTKPPVKVGFFLSNHFFYHLSADANLILENAGSVNSAICTFPRKIGGIRKMPRRLSSGQRATLKKKKPDFKLEKKMRKLFVTAAATFSTMSDHCSCCLNPKAKVWSD